MLKFAGEGCGELRLSRRVGAGDDGQRPIEFPHDLVAPGSEAGPEFGGGQRHPRRPVRVLHPVGDIPGDAQEAPGVERVAAPGEGVRFGDEDLEQLVIRQVDGGLGEGGAEAAQVSRGLDEGQGLTLRRGRL